MTALLAEVLAETPFQRLASRVPNSANALVLVNVEQAAESPAGTAQGFANKAEQAFRDGTSPIPPGALRFLLAAELDLEFMSPVWEAAVMDLVRPPSMTAIAKAYRGQADSIEGFAAVSLPQDAYVLRFGEQTLGVMAPANRQAVVRWARQQSSGPSKLSPYLQQQIADKAASGDPEISMAIDLDGVIAPQRVSAALEGLSWLQDEMIDVAELTQLLNTVQGVQIGVRLSEPPTGRIVVNFQRAPKLPPAAAKRLLLHVLAEKEMLIEDFQQWQPETHSNSVSLAGSLSPAGIRKLLSLIEMPAHGAGSADLAEGISTATADSAATAAAKTKAYFKGVTALADDLQEDMRAAKNLASTSLFFDKYARRIERLPMLDVDPEMLDYGAFIASQLREAAGGVRTMGIRTGARTKGITSANTNSDYYYGGYGYGRYGHGGYGYGGTAAMQNELKAIEQQRGVVRAEERAVAATSVHEIRAAMIAATSDIRRKMTEKYRQQF